MACPLAADYDNDAGRRLRMAVAIVVYACSMEHYCRHEHQAWRCAADCCSTGWRDSACSNDPQDLYGLLHGVGPDGERNARVDDYIIC
jgi:hypothetical protein